MQATHDIAFRQRKVGLLGMKVKARGRQVR
jgi:hypothetical protein